MDDQLYLFEILIDNIHFEDVVAEVPRKKLIVVSVKLGNIVTLEIRSETLPQSGEGPSKRHIEFKSGKSYLCSLSANGLLDILDKQPIEISLGLRGDVVPIGSSVTPWDECYKEMVLTSTNPEEFVAPATTVNSIYIMGNDVIKGSIQMFLRLSCFGKSIQTQFEVLQEPGAPNRQFIFKTCNTATTFACSRYGKGSSHEFIPVNAIFNASSIRRAATEKPNMKSVSWTAINQQLLAVATRTSASVADNGSEFLFPEYLNIVPPMKDSAQTFDIVSLAGRPDEDKFLDFLTGKKLEDPNRSTITLSVLDTEGNEKLIFFAADIFTERTVTTGRAEEKPTKACQCENTPIICKHVLDAIRRYEQTHPDLMIHGRRVKYEKISENIDDSDSMLRLRGGQDEEDDLPYVHKKRKGCYNPICPMAMKLRSVGISQFQETTNEMTENENKYFCADFYCAESGRRNIALQVVFSEDKVPFDFDCPNKYCPAAKLFKKLGLGPTATEKCQGMLYGPVKSPVQYGLSHTYGTFDTYGPYGIFSQTDTPYLPSEEEKNKSRNILRLRGGGTPDNSVSQQTTLKVPSRSPITECQEIMEQFDQILEEYRKALGTAGDDFENFLTPNLSNNCGHPRCTYITQPPLPPIHWDCPNPLPVGLCENPDCPYLPQDLKRICKILEARGHANGNRYSNQTELPLNDLYQPTPQSETYSSRDGGKCQCPFYNPSKTINMMMQSYNKPSPFNYNAYFGKICSNPNCPLQNPQLSCPNIQKQSKERCTNPDCPSRYITESFSNIDDPEDITKSCSNPDCPFQKVAEERCQNRDCPFKKVSEERCQNPDCPFKKVSEERCQNPDCPFKKVSEEMCQNPDCPFKRVSEQSCQNPDCPFKEVSDERCQNPDCPFKKVSEESCQNPDCPFKQKESSDSSCGNPQCPLKAAPFKFTVSSSSECKCDNPDCPANIEICSNSECPLNYQNIEICENPKCPYKSQGSPGKRKIRGAPIQTVCGDVTCPFLEGADGQKTKGRQSTIGGGDGTSKTDGPVDLGYIEYKSGDRPTHYDKAPCKPKTCKFMGGQLKCVDCSTLADGIKPGPCPRICPGDDICPGSKTQQKKKRAADAEKRALRRARRQFIYHLGDEYPGRHVGHNQCVVNPFHVPSKMGWLWNIQTPVLNMKPRKGWRPGAIGKTILDIIQAHRKSQNMSPLESEKRKRKAEFGRDSDMDLIQPKPTLQIKRREGVYYITMNPLKDPRTLVTNENPYMEVTPLQFKIMKNKENNDYKSCVCTDQGIEYEPEGSSSDSELDIEFTPPAGLIRPERFVRIRDVIHIDTQYDTKDFNTGPPEKKKKGNKKKKGKKDKKKGKKKKK